MYLYEQLLLGIACQLAFISWKLVWKIKFIMLWNFNEKLMADPIPVDPGLHFSVHLTLLRENSKKKLVKDCISSTNTWQRYWYMEILERVHQFYFCAQIHSEFGANGNASNNHAPFSYNTRTISYDISGYVQRSINNNSRLYSNYHFDRITQMWTVKHISSLNSIQVIHCQTNQHRWDRSAE